MAFLQIEDLTNNAEIIIFPKLFAKIEHALNQHTMFIIKGTLDTMNTPVCKILAQELCPIDLFFEKWPHIELVTLILPEQTHPIAPTKIKENLTPGKIAVHIVFYEQNKMMILKPFRRFALSFEGLQQLATDYNITIKINF